MQQFTNLYSLSKTLRFELKPVAETAERINDFKNQGIKSIVAEDKKRAEDYKQMKKILDDYHRHFIEQALQEPILTEEELDEYFEIYVKSKASGNDSQAKDNLAKNQQILRKNLTKCFESKSKDYYLYKGDFSKLINKHGSGNKKEPGHLWKWLKSLHDHGDISEQEFEQKQEYLENFNDFSTYFTGFNKNRDNMYSDQEHQTAISYRVVNENATRHFDNCLRFNSLQQNYPQLAEELAKFEALFKPIAFKDCLSQSEIDKYNETIGHQSDDIYAKGVNQIINEYRQKNHIEPKKLPVMAVLYKQILSDIESRFIIDKFTKDDEVFEAIKSLHEVISKSEMISSIRNLLNEFLTNDNDKNFYIKSGPSLTAISNSLWGSWAVIPEALNNYAENHLNLNSKKKDKWLKQDYYLLRELQEAINLYAQANETIQAKDICQYFRDFKTDDIDFQQLIETRYNELTPVLELDRLHKDRSIKGSNDCPTEGFLQVEKIRLYLDSVLALVQFLKPLYLEKGGKLLEITDSYTDFYDLFNILYKKLDISFAVYNKVRNYLTKKPYSTDKFKINFQNSTLLDGWDVNKETANTSVLLIKNGKYYLGIMAKQANTLFDYRISDEDSAAKIAKKKELAQEVLAGDNEDYFDKMVYKLLPDPSKMLPKVFFSKKNKEFYAPDDDMIKIREDGLFKKEAANKDALSKWIKFMIFSINKHPEWSRYFNFNFRSATEYPDVSSFYKDVADQGYNIAFDKIKTSYIEEKIASGELYLFEIYSKDFSPFSKGKPNLHTSYWKLLFDKKNLSDVVLKLNGQAEIFFRPASLKKDEVAVHKKNQPVANKNPLTEKKYSKFDYDIIKDKRYTIDKFFLHCPIAINFKAGSTGKFNEQVNSYITASEDVNIIGIDRGERHLLYYCLIDQNGKIKEQDSLNMITNTLESDQRKVTKTTDYHKLLDHREKQRDASRKSWSTVENIKELKSGYLSHVVNKVARLMVQHNAIVVLEDLNFGFKRGRFKFEKQVYQKFEKALIDKLNYLVFKDRDFGQPGHYLKAYQLTAPFDSFSKLGKQSGFLYYTASHYTSKIDPVTGFASLVNFKYESADKSRSLLSKFDSIRYNAKNDYFEFHLDYAKFTDKAGDKTKWTLCTHGKERYYFTKQDGYKCCDITSKLKELFDRYKIDYSCGEEMLDSITSVAFGKTEETEFYKNIMFYLHLLLRLRYTFKTDSEELDYILSPVADNDGNFFDSRNFNKESSVPCDADANGAFNIARKGLFLINNIRDTGKATAISNKDWFDFVQKE